jgi:hypothetical protein
MLRGVGWQLISDVSEQPTSPIFKGQAAPEELITQFIDRLTHDNEVRVYQHQQQRLLRFVLNRDENNLKFSQSQ